MINSSSSSSHPSKVKLYGQPNSAAAYEIRDFLSRSVVEFDWIELTSDQDCDRELNISTLSDKLMCS
jgi:thioredoxin reductase (NADPH)